MSVAADPDVSCRHDAGTRIDARFARHAHLIALLLLLAAGTLRAQEYSESPVQPDTAAYDVRELTYHRRRISVSIACPVLTDLPRATRRTLNRMLLADARSQLAAQRDDLLGAARELSDVEHFYADRFARVWIVDSALVSVLYSWDVYSGGAHPGGYYEGVVYQVVGGRIHEVPFAELFRAESGWDTVVADLITAEIKRHDPDNVFDPEELRSQLRESGFGVFAITRDGLLFADWPGPHVVGPTETLLPWEVLAPYLDPKGVLGRFAHP